MAEQDDTSRTENLLRVVISCLEERHVKYARYEDSPTLVFLAHTDSAIHACTINVRERRPLVRCLLYVACRVPPEKRAGAAELFARINYGLGLGGFELDCTDGEIRYRTSIDVAGGDLTPEMVAALIFTTVGTVDRYYPAIMAFLWNDMAPEDAVAMIEEAPED